MDTNLVLIWLIVAACVLNARPALSLARAGRPSFLIVFALIAGVAAGGSLLGFSGTGKLVALLFGVLVMLPSWLQRRISRLTGAQRYDDAVPYARALALLHPASGFRELPRLLYALSLAQHGQHAEAEAELSDLAEGPSNPTRTDAQAQLARLRGDWPDYLARTDQLSAAALNHDLNTSLGRQRALGAREHAHDQTYGGQATLKRSYVTLAMLTLNLLAFAAEELSGGSEDGPTLYRLGAAVTGVLSLPEAYRLLTALFLHFGVLHLSLNMLNLALLGPFVESSIGRLRTLAVYLVSGVSGSLLVALIPREEPGLFLGASGCIMGLLGATAGILLHGHRAERSLIARTRLQRLALPLLLQLAFDLSVPGISLTAHWTGVVVGLALGRLFQGQVRARVARAPTSAVRS